MDSSTSKRIMDAAIEVFMEKGYAATTVRDICARAGTNVAAVNYHFGSKDGLHAAVLNESMTEVHSRQPLTEGLDQARSGEERLRLFIHNLLRVLFPQVPEESRKAKLFWLELANPSPALQPLVERFMRPIKDTLESIVQELAGPLDTATLRDCVGSIVGQQLFHAQNLALTEQLYPGVKYQPKDVARLEEHVYHFSLAGIRALRGLRAKDATQQPHSGK